MLYLLAARAISFTSCPRRPGSSSPLYQGLVGGSRPARCGRHRRHRRPDPEPDGHLHPNLGSARDNRRSWTVSSRTTYGRKSLYREGVALGLDRDERSIRRAHAPQKLEFVSEDAAQLARANGAELVEFQARMRTATVFEARLALQPGIPGPVEARRQVEADVASLASRTAQPSGGTLVSRDSRRQLMLDPRYDEVTAGDVARLFGAEFEARLRGQGPSAPGADRSNRLWRPSGGASRPGRRARGATRRSATGGARRLDCRAPSAAARRAVPTAARPAPGAYRGPMKARLLRAVYGLAAYVVLACCRVVATKCGGVSRTGPAGAETWDVLIQVPAAGEDLRFGLYPAAVRRTCSAQAPPRSEFSARAHVDAHASDAAWDWMARRSR